MIDSEIQRFIKETIRNEMNIILSGISQGSNVKTEDIGNMYPNMPTQPSRPLMHPFGFASRAPVGTPQVVARQGDHLGNRLVLGHRDENRPSDLAVGEAEIYSIGGYKIRFYNDKIQLAKGSDFETLVAGETLIEFLKVFVEDYLMHRHTGNLGYPTTPLINQQPLTEAEAEFLDNEKILAKDGGRY